MRKTKFIVAFFCLCRTTIGGDVPLPPGPNIQTYNETSMGSITSSNVNQNGLETSSFTLAGSEELVLKFDFPQPEAHTEAGFCSVYVDTSQSKECNIRGLLRDWTQMTWNNVMGADSTYTAQNSSDILSTNFVGNNWVFTNDVKDHVQWMVDNNKRTGFIVYTVLNGTLDISTNHVLTVYWTRKQADPNFDGQAGYSVDDLDAIATKIAQSQYDWNADLDYDDNLDLSDRDLMIGVIDSVLGDVNGDGIFNSTDLIEVFQAAKYETMASAKYSEGDWNCDGEFDSGDLVAVFQAGTYVNGAAAMMDDWEELE